MIWICHGFDYFRQTNHLTFAIGSPTPSLVTRLLHGCLPSKLSRLWGLACKEYLVGCYFEKFCLCQSHSDFYLGLVTSGLIEANLDKITTAWLEPALLALSGPWPTEEKLRNLTQPICYGLGMFCSAGAIYSKGLLGLTGECCSDCFIWCVALKIN